MTSFGFLIDNGEPFAFGRIDSGDGYRVTDARTSSTSPTLGR